MARIAISTLVTPAQKMGVGYYLVNLVKALGNIGSQNEYVLLCSDESAGLFPQLPENVTIERIPVKDGHGASARISYLNWQNRSFASFAKKHAIEALHLPNQVVMLGSPIPLVVTIHDVAEFSTKRYSPARQAFRRAVLKKTARSADIVLTVSEFSKQEIVRYLQIDPSRILVSKPGVTVRSGSSLKPDHLAEGNPFLLYAGSNLEHKNFTGLLESFAQARRTGSQLNLIATIPEKGLNSRQLDVARPLLEAGALSLTGYLPDGKLKWLFQNCAAYISLSNYEGFGLPLLEALQYGKPVILSRIGAHEEVAGRLGLYVDGSKPTEVAQKIVELEADFPNGEALVNKRLERANEFSWESCAKASEAAFFKAISRK